MLGPEIHVSSNVVIGSTVRQTLENDSNAIYGIEAHLLIKNDGG